MAQEVILKEVSIMRGMRHPAVLPLLASFTHEKHLWLVTPYYSGGSLQSIMEYSNPEVGSLVPFILNSNPQ